MQSDHKKLIRIKQVIQLTGLSRTSIYHYVNTGDFPHYTKFGKSSLWEYTEIQDWINQRLQERDNKAS